jgi:hypothetical protein
LTEDGLPPLAELRFRMKMARELRLHVLPPTIREMLEDLMNLPQPEEHTIKTGLFSKDRITHLATTNQGL